MPATPGWTTQVGLCSAQTGLGIAEAWQRIETFYHELGPKGAIAERRRQQMLDWLKDLVREELQRNFYDDPRVEQALPAMRHAVLQGAITAPQAAAALLATHAGQAPELKN